MLFLRGRALKTTGGGNVSDVNVRTQRFFGLNRQPYIEEGEMVDMKNLCSDAFPCIKPRERREEYKHTSNNTLKESDYEENVSYLPVAGKEIENHIYKYTYTPDEYVNGAFYKYTGGKWERMTEYLCSYEVVTEHTNYGYWDPTIKKDWYTDEMTYEILGGNGYYGHSSLDSYMTDKNYAVKYLGEDSEGFAFGKTYRYNVRWSYEWKAVNKSSTGIEKVTELPEASKERFRQYIYLTVTTEEHARGVYECICRYQGYWEECEEEYTCESEFPAEAVEGQIIRYVGEIKTPIYGLCYKVSIDTKNGENIYFHIQVPEVETDKKVQELPEATEESYKTIYVITKPSSSGYYKCVYSEGEYIWKELSRPDTTKALSLVDYINGYVNKNINIKRILKIHEHNGKLAAILQSSGSTYFYYDYALYGIDWASENTPMISLGYKILIGDGGAYYDTNEKEFRSGTNAFDFSIYGMRGEKGWTTAGGSNIDHVCESYISDTEIVLYSDKKENLSSAYQTLNAAGIDFEIKTAYSQGWDYATTKAAAELVYDSLRVNLGDAGWDEWGMWRLTIPIQEIAFPPSLTSNEDGYGEGWVYLRKTSKNSRFLWKNRLWGYSENNLISTILEVLDENGDIDWQTVADGRNDNGAYTLPFMTGGNVTGIAALRDYITVFKRNHLCTLSGNTSATFLMNTVPAFGLSEENEKSIAVRGNTVFYMSDGGVYAFSGDYPVLLSEKAKLEGVAVCAAADNRFYYLSLRQDDVYTNYRYDIERGIWYKMDNVHIRQYCSFNGKMMYIDADAEKLMTIGEDEKVEWEAVLLFDEGTWRKKKYKEFAVYGDFKEIDVIAKPDDGPEMPIIHLNKPDKIPVIPILCEKLTIKLRGRGDCIIKGFERKYEVV